MVGLVADKLGGKLFVTDKDGERRVGLGIDKTAGHIGISNSGGKPVAVIGTTPIGEGIMWTTEESGKLATWSSSPSKLADEIERQHYR